jgi:enediyne biosynthesis protein E4
VIFAVGANPKSGKTDKKYAIFALSNSIMHTHQIGYLSVLIGFLLCATACKPENTEKKAASNPFFEEIDAKKAGISFENTLPYSEQVNCYLFKNFYNGGGVAVGDVNADGLPDLFFCGNRESNRLYLNRGGLQFEDITDAAGLRSDGDWTTGASFVDVNGDALLDLYVCKSGPPDLAVRKNQLFINQGNGKFENQAAAWGVDVMGLSAHAVFFDYDHDGDQDFYLLSNSIRSVGGYDLREGQRNKRDPMGANKLFRNDGTRFTDVSAQAGIYGSAIGFGLGVAVGDYNRDGWQDMFVSNDYFERDYLYLNTGKGSFSEVGDRAMSEMSMGSMGADIADLNNDLYPDIYVTEMLPSDYGRYKTKTQFDNWNKFALMEQSGYHHQYTRNVLQLNQQDGQFAEVGRYAGVEATDWSWGALLADFDLDGWKDVFVANGIGKDLLDQDYIAFYSDPAAVRQVLQGNGITSLIDKMPSAPQVNRLFRNTGQKDLVRFDDATAISGWKSPTFSNGSIYADLDNDGDLDLVVNNLNAAPGIFRNQNRAGHHWASFVCKDQAPNHFGLGAQVTIKTKNGYQFQEISPMRGFQSCTDTRLHFGLGDAQIIDSLWCSFTSSQVGMHRMVIKTNVAADQLHTILATEATLVPMVQPGILGKENPFFATAPQSALTRFVHQQGYTGDFDREPLLYHMYSTNGPALAIGDINADGLDDCFVGGGVGQAGAVFVQATDGAFQQIVQTTFDANKSANDVCATFFDADKDKDLDLYVGSGCNGDAIGNTSLGDRIYINDGRGKFTLKADALPGMKPFGTAWVQHLDLNADGADDILVGMRAVNGRYGSKTGIFAMLNDGTGRFAPDMSRVQYDANQYRMSTASDLADLDGDADLDLVIAMDWGAPLVLFNTSGRFAPGAIATGLETYRGWWSSVKAVDLNGDGYVDFAVGGHGENSRFHASAKQPITLYLNDLDQNGTIDPLLTTWWADGAYPFAQRADVVKQIPLLKKQILKSEAFAALTLAQIEAGTHTAIPQRDSLTVTELRSMAFINDGKGHFTAQILPAEAQLSTVMGMTTFDVNGKTQLVIGGNQYYAKPECGGQLASSGAILQYSGQSWLTSKSAQTGLNLRGNVRQIGLARGKNGKQLLIATRTGQSVLVQEMKSGR